MACKKFDILTIALLLIPERGNRPNCHVGMAIGADGYDRDGRFGCHLPSIGSQQMSSYPAIDHLLRTNMTQIAHQYDAYCQHKLVFGTSYSHTISNNPLSANQLDQTAQNSRICEQTTISSRRREYWGTIIRIKLYILTIHPRFSDKHINTQKFFEHE